MRATHTIADETVEIQVEGLSDTVNMLHITDAHVSILDDRDDLPQEVEEACYDHAENYGSTHGDTFGRMLTEGDAASKDVIALTGDIVHLPSQAAVEYVSNALSDLTAPVLYTSGNHDWHFPKMRNKGDLREEWLPALEPLHKGSPSHSRTEVSGLQFICVEDSTYQISEEQLNFVQKSLENGVPTVILTHIPLSLPTLRQRTIERWNHSILIADPVWPLEGRQSWGTTEDAQTTLAFHRLLSHSENLVAVFCGHIHFSHMDAISRTAVQYVTAPCFDGEKRQVVFSPMD